MSKFWDERYSQEEYVYGIQPNAFFKEQLDKLNPGKILMFGEGEGRNAVYAAKNGWKVDAVDFSEEGKKKALRLAERNHVSINYSVKSFEEFIPEKDFYDAVGIIFIHLDFNLSQLVHSRAIDALKPGGKIILEVFEKDQLGKASGGPQEISKLYRLENIRTNFAALHSEIFQKETELLSEGEFHSGEGVVIKFVGIK
ncbi:MAG: methyltransferase domain-containing protein [Bacteroidetes bacterium]|nr:methyltransferase domain-containing protein [Bacteroidota bacterium]